MHESDCMDFCAIQEALAADFIIWYIYILGCPPPVTVANEGLGWDLPLKI